MADQTITFDPNAYTIGEMEEFEDLTGHSIAKLYTTGEMPLRALRALLYINRRRTDPAVTFDGLKDVKLSELSDMLEGLRPPA
jgi:hypothetical protein